MGTAELTGNATHAVHDIVDHLLANGVVTTGVVVGSILLAADQQLRVKELAVGASSNLVDGGRVEIDEDGARNMLASAGLGEEGLVGTGVAQIGGIGVGKTIRSEAVLEKVAIGRRRLALGMVSGSKLRRLLWRKGVNVQLPSRVTELGTSLAQVEVDNLYHEASASASQVRL